MKRGYVIWMTGLSGSGKTTIANGLKNKFFEEGRVSIVLDGDITRGGLNKDLGLSLEDRFENIRRASEVAKILIDQGIIVICSFITPTNKIRDLIKSILKDDVVNVFINTSIELCKKRDPKGLYKKVESGEIKNFTGIDSPFEIPKNADIEIKTDNFSIVYCVNHTYTNIKRIKD